MTHELAKELKDAGFPQEYDEGTVIFNETTNTEYVWCGEACSILTEDEVVIPKLGELIAACGEAFDYLWFPPYEISGKEKWCTKPKWDWRKLITGEKQYMEGKTPEEAVAKLWLALNK